MDSLQLEDQIAKADVEGVEAIRAEHEVLRREAMARGAAAAVEAIDRIIARASVSLALHREAAQDARIEDDEEDLREQMEVAFAEDDDQRVEGLRENLDALI